MPTVKRAIKRTAKVDDSRLKIYLDATKHDSVLLGPVDRWLQLQPNDRDATVIHPSEMVSKDWCPRATWHRLMGKAVPIAPVALRPNLIFETGHDTHHKWQRWATHMGILWGKWYCPACDQSVLGWSNEIQMTGCRTWNGTHLWVYKEVPLALDSHKIGGHADGIVNPTGDESVLLEVKTIGPGTMRLLDLLAEHESDDISSDRFSKITRPAPSHFRQTQIYLRLSEKWKEYVGPVNRAVIVYEHKADQQVREFVITRNDKYTDPLFETAMDIVWAIDKDREVACPHGGCAKCQAFEVEY